MPFYDLAGSHFVTLPTGLNTTQLELSLSSKANIWETGQKSKLIFDGYEIDDIELIIDKIAIDKKLHIEIQDYNSNFFQLSRLEGPNWLHSNPCTGFVTELIDHSKITDIAIIKNLLISSFAVKISKNEEGITIFEENLEKQNLILDNFDSTFLQSDLLTYLIKTDEGLIVGSYSLFAQGDEVQLSAVAGRSTLTNIFKGKKLIPLCYSMVSNFVNNPIFANQNTLTLSNSKQPVAQLYRELGFEVNTKRKGLLVKVN